MLPPLMIVSTWNQDKTIINGGNITTGQIHNKARTTTRNDVRTLGAGDLGHVFLVAFALGAGGLFGRENAHLGAVPGIILPVVGQGVPGSKLQAAARVRPDFGFNVVRKRRANSELLPGVHRSMQRQAFDRAARCV